MEGLHIAFVDDQARAVMPCMVALAEYLTRQQVVISKMTLYLIPTVPEAEDKARETFERDVPNIELTVHILNDLAMLRQLLTQNRPDFIWIDFSFGDRNLGVGILIGQRDDLGVAILTHVSPDTVRLKFTNEYLPPGVKVVGKGEVLPLRYPRPGRELVGDLYHAIEDLKKRHQNKVTNFLRTIKPKEISDIINTWIDIEIEIPPKDVAPDTEGQPATRKDSRPAWQFFHHCLHPKEREETLTVDAIWEAYGMNRFDNNSKSLKCYCGPWTGLLPDRAAFELAIQRNLFFCGHDRGCKKRGHVLEKICRESPLHAFFITPAQIGAMVEKVSSLAGYEFKLWKQRGLSLQDRPIEVIFDGHHTLTAKVQRDQDRPLAVNLLTLEEAVEIMVQTCIEKRGQTDATLIHLGVKTDETDNSIVVYAWADGVRAVKEDPNNIVFGGHTKKIQEIARDHRAEFVIGENREWNGNAGWERRWMYNELECGPPAPLTFSPPCSGGFGFQIRIPEQFPLP